MMKTNQLLAVLILFTIVSCSGNDKKQKSEPGRNQDKVEVSDVLTAKDDKGSVKSDICWEGTLNGKTPVFIHYQIVDELIIGEITYLSTKGKQPIKIIGELMEGGKSFRILEFEKSGNVSGILSGEIAEKSIKGSWFSPKTRKELTLKLEKSDSLVPSVSQEYSTKSMFGEYHYQYSKDGYLGDFEIKKLPGAKALFNVNSVTGEPSRNMAMVDADTVNISNGEFSYDVPEAESCGFKVKFYKDFIYIKYTTGDCLGDFGHNATVEGIYLKVK